MRADINRLYDPVIKAHNANPFHFKKIESPVLCFKAYNPVCGDKYEFYLEQVKDRISTIYFYGFGCAVSKAAGSLLTQSLEGKRIADAINICENYLKLIQENKMNSNLPKEFLAFAVVRDFPARYACAAMACEEMLKFLRNLNYES